ncbi:MAG: beta-ketoacyl-[acyl-carrier-protein] synthase II, partial [Spirochaetales bacterium]
MNIAKRVVITGMGTVNPLGLTVKDTWEKIINGKSGIGPITRFDASTCNSRVAGEVKDFDFRSCFPEDFVRTAKRLGTFVHYAAAGMKEALTQSGLDIAKAPEQVGICIGCGMGGVKIQHENSAALIAGGGRKVSPFYIPGTIGNIASGFLSMVYGIKGPNLSTQTACATANHSIGVALLMIRAGMADAFITGGTESVLDEVIVHGFANMRALSTKYNDTPEKASRPYDTGRDGFVIAEGAGVLVLEEYEQAKKRGADIICEVLAVGMS